MKNLAPRNKNKQKHGLWKLYDLSKNRLGTSGLFLNDKEVGYFYYINTYSDKIEKTYYII